MTAPQTPEPTPAVKAAAAVIADAISPEPQQRRAERLARAAMTAALDVDEIARAMYEGEPEIVEGFGVIQWERARPSTRRAWTARAQRSATHLLGGAA